MSRFQLFKAIPQPTLEKDFQDKRKLLLPTLGFCFVFFTFYYALLIIPRFGIDSTVFLIDNLGGAFIISGFAISFWITKYIKKHVLLLLPSFMTLSTTTVFLAHEEFYTSVQHLWLSAQIIGIVFATYLGHPKWNTLLFILNVTIPPIVATQISYLSPADIVYKQAIVYFASLISIFLSYSFLLKKAELMKARDKALKAEKIKSDFLANMSHELRTPMNSVVGALQMLQRQELAANQSELVVRGLLSSKSLLAIINDILDFSKMEAGQLTYDPVDTNIIALAEEISYEMEPIADDKNICLKLIIEDNLHPYYSVDPVRLKQVLFNLISNAIKFTHQGHVELKLSVNEQNIIVDVTDTGIGMNEKAIQKLFDRFTQADVSTTREYGGTGLGMAICQQIVEMMNGAITVDSEVGKGTNFKVSLPLAKVADVEDKTRSNQQVQAPDCQGKTFLLAEDNLVNQKIFSAMIKPTQSHLDIAADGQQAIELYQTKSFDLVFP